MAISTEDLAKLGKVALDEYVRNAPIDQVSHNRPFLQWLMKGRKQFLGAKQGVVQNIRTSVGSNFQWGYGETAVEFKPRDTTDQVLWKWARCTDTLSISYDRLFGAGIHVVEGKAGQFKLEQNEKVQLVNLLQEQGEVLQEGFFASLDKELHRSGTASADAIVGLDALVALKPQTGTVGGIDAAKAAYWRNQAALGVAAADLPTTMEHMWRDCSRYGGNCPDMILAGSDFIDAYRSSITVTQNADANKVKTFDFSTGKGLETGLYFKGVPITWDPTFDDLDATESLEENKWSKRCYMLSSKRMAYLDDGMQLVTPTRPYNVLSMYQMILVRSVLTMNQRNAHGVITLA